MKTIEVLDHGFVTLRNIAGPTRRPDALFDADDIDPANAARMSFDSMDSGREREADLKLTRYLIKNAHTTPLESIVIWLQMRLPIFVARQFVRHRTTSISEISARYVTLPSEWYVPLPENVTMKAASNKQGRSAEQHPEAEHFIRQLDDDCRDSYTRYCNAVEAGIPNELARCHLHVNHYTEWLWQQNLHNLMHFIRLREDSHAQWEAQQYAKAIKRLLTEQLPDLMEIYGNA
jgi:thymidylate synthase (FAD)